MDVAPGDLDAADIQWLLFNREFTQATSVGRKTSSNEENLSQSWKDGIQKGRTLFVLIRDRGYDGSLAHLQRLLAG